MSGVADDGVAADDGVFFAGAQGRVSAGLGGEAPEKSAKHKIIFNTLV